jgi:hypothetical protein
MKMKKPIVFDIDGTLTEECYNEDNLLILRENSAMVLIALSMQSERPLLISTARPEFLRDQTEKWLSSHGLNPDDIYMRPNDQDGLPDQIIKFNHLSNIIHKYGRPLAWVDDNEDNVNMLRRNNIPTIHVNHP